MDSNEISADNFLLRDYRPTPMLKVEAHQVDRARFPAIDAHAHLGRLADPGEIADILDEANIASLVNLDGRWGGELSANLDRYDHAYPGRYVTFCRLNWDECGTPGWTDRFVASVADSARRGACGVKIEKWLGLQVRDEHDELILSDDRRLGPVWEAIGESRLPVLIHIGDPAAFFEPFGSENERLEHLLERPTWRFNDFGFGPDTLPRLLDALEAVVARHNSVTFIGAHVGCYAEDLGWVGRMLDTYPNFNIDISARLGELGRQPRATAALIRKHPTRCLFGSDYGAPRLSGYGPYFRFLETADEYFSYSHREPPLQGRWRIYGLDLDDDLLRHVYSENARRVIPALSQSGVDVSP